jgi:uncharacterized membrane protein YdjX (TVP38/TMEM64 family)
VLSIAAALIFGAWVFPLVVIAATIGAVLAFLVSRYLAREFVRTLLQRRTLFRALDRAIEQEGWKIVALFRLNPLVPFNLQNYFFGATAIGLRPYALATVLGIMPGTAVNVYLGTLAGVAAGADQVSGVELALLIIGFLATLLMVVILGRAAKGKLQALNVGEDR